MLFGITIVSNELHDWNNNPCTSVIPLGNFTIFKDEQFLNAPAPKVVTEFGIINSLIDEQPANAFPPMYVKVDGRDRLVSDVIDSKPLVSILSTPSSRFNSVIAVQFWNAPRNIKPPLTVTSFNEPGM